MKPGVDTELPGDTAVNKASLRFSILFLITCMCLCGYFAHEYRCLQRPKESIRYPGAGVIGDCEPFDMGTEKQTVLYQGIIRL